MLFLISLLHYKTIGMEVMFYGRTYLFSVLTIVDLEKQQLKFWRAKR